MSSAKFFGSKALAKRGTKVRSRRRGGFRNETGSQVRLLAANRKLSAAVLLFISSFLFLLVPSLSAQEKKLDPFTISYASVSGTRGPLWIAQDLGLFAKYGLDVNLVYIASGVISVNALLGGSVDIIAASGSSVVSAAA
jgi:ABC-type nitrate/sulfonate/bicarbonate transport system substrate-binding protein